MTQRKWEAQWIDFNPEPNNINLQAVIGDAAPIFYKYFFLDEKPGFAQIYISGLGFYKLLINGKRVGDQLLAPAFTVYDKKVFYNVYDISDFLISGENKIEVILGSGWFFENTPTGWKFDLATWHYRHQLICEVFADGKLIVKSDSSWMCGRSKITFNSLRSGEVFDNTAEICNIMRASIGRGPGGVLVEQNCPHIKLQRVFEPVNVENGIYDFGINVTGNVQITVKGKRGSKVVIQYTERISEDGEPSFNMILPRNLLRFQKDEYILSGEGEETWHSEFGYNGFRYVKIDTDAEIISVKARHFHTDLHQSGGFWCDNDFFNQLHDAVVHSTLCNFHHIPTDCPQREKNGWTADAHLSCEQALFNFDMRDAYMKWIQDIVDCQRPNGAIPCIAPTSIWGYDWGPGNTWDAALFEIPWQMYCFYGEKEVFEPFIPAMKKYLSFLASTSDNGIWKNGLGEWCPPKNAVVISDYAILTGYAYRIVDLYSKMTDVLGMTDEAVETRDWANDIRRTFIETFDGKEKDSQSFLAMQLYFNLTNQSKKVIFKRLVDCIENNDYYIDCGIFGVKWLFTLLSDYGRHDIACKILEKEGYPSYKEMLRLGNGCLSENWRCTTSLNHHMFSSVGEWFYKCVAGISYDENSVGFKNIKIKPNLSKSYSVFHAWHDTPFGRVSVKYSNGCFDIIIPEGTVADFEFNGKTEKLFSSKIIRI